MLGSSAWVEQDRASRLRWLRECRRLRNKDRFEQRGGAFPWVAGVDEVGRGALAGPVVSAAVILPMGTLIFGLRDSKKLSAKQRTECYQDIVRHALAIGVARQDADVIDANGIRWATFASMRCALDRLPIRPTEVLVDGRDTIPGLQLAQRAVIGGDGRSNAIAAASIVAKVVRDLIMIHLHDFYPHYAFANNKGYGTLPHRNALASFGVSSVHRRTFLKMLDSGQTAFF